MTFAANELLALDPEELRGLLDAADGYSVLERAAALGLDPLMNRSHHLAISAAVPELAAGTQPFSPPIGAGRPGVRLDLTPTETGAAPLVDADQADPVSATGSSDLPADFMAVMGTADPEAAADLASTLDHSAQTGEPFMAGTFAIYGHPSGAVVMVTETTGYGLRKDVIPRKAVRFALSMMAGSGSGKRGLLARMMMRG